MSVRLERLIPVLMVRDVQASIRFYADCLGFALTFQDAPIEPRYVGMERDGILIHMQWHDASEWGYPNDRPTYRIVVQDVDGLHRELAGRIARCTHVWDTDWGTREFHIQDPDMNGLQFYRMR